MFFPIRPICCVTTSRTSVNLGRARLKLQQEMKAQTALVSSFEPSGANHSEQHRQEIDVRKFKASGDSKLTAGGSEVMQ